MDKIVEVYIQSVKILTIKTYLYQEKVKKPKTKPYIKKKNDFPNKKYYF